MEQTIDWAHMLETKEIVRQIHELNLLHNVWFIAAVILFVAISLFMKWNLLLTCTISVSALIALISFVSERGANLGQGSDGIFYFVGGGAAIMFFFIYMIFMRGD